MKIDGPILRARFPKPQPKQDTDRNLPTPWRYDNRTSSAASTAAFHPDRVDEVFRRFDQDPRAPKTKWDYGNRNEVAQVVNLEKVTVSAQGAELATRREFLTAAGQRSPAADAYAAKLRKMNLKICWSRESHAEVVAPKPSDLAQVRGRLQAMHQKPVPEGDTGMPGYRLKAPCKHCPFAPGKERIQFRSRERALEIIHRAYMNGFPCHESAVPNDDGGYVFGLKTQHCAGAMMMFIADGQSAWPGVGNDRTIPDKLLNHLDWTAPYYTSEAEFLDDNTNEDDREAHDDHED